MKIASLIARLLLGALMVFAGSNHIFNFLPKAPLPPGVAGQFLGAMIATGYLSIVGACEVARGAVASRQSLCAAGPRCARRGHREHFHRESADGAESFADRDRRHHSLDSGGVSGSHGIPAVVAAARCGLILERAVRFGRDRLATIAVSDDPVPLSRARGLRRGIAPAAGAGRAAHRQAASATCFCCSSIRPCSRWAATPSARMFWRRTSFWPRAASRSTRSTAAATSPITAPASSSATPSSICAACEIRSGHNRLGPVDFVRLMEEALIRVCGEFGVQAGRICGLTGVWCGLPEPLPSSESAPMRRANHNPPGRPQDCRHRHSRRPRRDLARICFQRHYRSARLRAYQSLRHH